MKKGFGLLLGVAMVCLPARAWQHDDHHNDEHHSDEHRSEGLLPARRLRQWGRAGRSMPMNAAAASRR
jgi:hypothetical protein